MERRQLREARQDVLFENAYQREFFVSQTPELAAMADAVIDLDALAAG